VLEVLTESPMLTGRRDEAERVEDDLNQLFLFRGIGLLIASLGEEIRRSPQALLERILRRFEGAGYAGRGGRPETLAEVLEAILLACSRNEAEGVSRQFQNPRLFR
jgi:hypothetical protein